MARDTIRSTEASPWAKELVEALRDVGTNEKAWAIAESFRVRAVRDHINLENATALQATAHKAQGGNG
jgi:hypothetical protein